MRDRGQWSTGEIMVSDVHPQPVASDITQGTVVPLDHGGSMEEPWYPKKSCFSNEPFAQQKMLVASATLERAVTKTKGQRIQG